MQKRSDPVDQKNRDSEEKEKSAGRSGAELIMPYGGEASKGEQVEEMFDAIAPAYDFMNTAMTLGLHRWWRHRALAAAGRRLADNLDKAAKADACADGRGLRILDVATGTGDVAFELHKIYPEAGIVGLDLSKGMLAVAEKKLKSAGESARKHITFRQGDSLALEDADNSYDLITVAYGVRNFEQLGKGLAEMGRVLKPGGVICIIELAEPTGALTRPLYRFYSRQLIPRVGKLVSGDSRAYTYLPESISAAPQRDRLTKMLADAGLHDCIWHQMTFGAVCYYLGSK